MRTHSLLHALAHALVHTHMNSLTHGLTHSRIHLRTHHALTHSTHAPTTVYVCFLDASLAHHDGVVDPLITYRTGRELRRVAQRDRPKVPTLTRTRTLTLILTLTLTATRIRTLTRALARIPKIRTRARKAMRRARALLSALQDTTHAFLSTAHIPSAQDEGSPRRR